MKHIIVISNDARTLTQISGRAKELKDETSIETFRTLADFQYFLDPKDDPNSKLSVDEANEQKKHSTYLQALFKEKGIHLIIVDQDVLNKEKPVEFIAKLKAQLLNTEYHKADIITRFFLLSFETNAEAIDALVSVHIDDLILKPLDDQLFLQKLAMALSEKRSSAGEFIYKQAVDSNIYIAQSAIIEELSDLGLSVRGRKPYKDGIIIRVFSKVFGERADSSLLIRTYKSIPHPTIPNEFRIYYTYYGIAANQLLRIRKTLQKLPKHSTPQGRTFSPAEIQILKKNKKKIAIVAFNPALRADVENAISSNFVNAETFGFPSLASFAKKLGIEPEQNTPAATPIAAPGATAATTSTPNAPASTVAVAPEIQIHPSAIVGHPDFIGPIYQAPEPTALFSTEHYIFTISHSDEIMNIDTKSSQFFDQTAPQMFANPLKWLTYIHPEDRDELREFLGYMKANEKGHILIRIKGPEGHVHYIRIDAEDVKAAATPQIKIQITEIKGEDGPKQWHAAHVASLPKAELQDLEAVILDASGVNQTIESWSLLIKAFLENAKILNEGKKVSIIALLPEKSVAKLDEFKKTFFSDVLFTPIDRKHLIEKVSFHVPGLYTANGLMTIPFEPITAEIKIAQEVKMEMASEFGIQIKSNKPLREGIFLRLFSSLFLDENYEGILARSYSSNVDEKNKSEYHNVFSFYGISDAFLKHIRKWIRDTYISQKESDKN